MIKDLFKVYWNETSQISNAFLIAMLCFILIDYIGDPGIRGIFIIIGAVFLVRSFFVPGRSRQRNAVDASPGPSDRTT